MLLEEYMKKTARSKSTLKVSRSVSSQLKEQSFEEMKSFAVHLIIYMLVMFGLFTYFYSYTSDLNMFFIVGAGWGIGVIVHGLAALGFMNHLHKQRKYY